MQAYFIKMMMTTLQEQRRYDFFLETEYIKLGKWKEYIKDTVCNGYPTKEKAIEQEQSVYLGWNHILVKKENRSSFAFKQTLSSLHDFQDYFLQGSLLFKEIMYNFQQALY